MGDIPPLSQQQRQCEISRHRLVPQSVGQVSCPVTPSYTVQEQTLRLQSGNERDILTSTSQCSIKIILTLLF